MNEISQRIMEAMKKADLSYGELAKLSGVPKSALQRYATGETTKIPLNRIEAIAKATNTKASYLLGWNREPDGFGDAWAIENYPNFKPGVNYISDFQINKKEAPEPEGPEADERIDIIEDELVSILVKLGCIRGAEDISDKDARFLIAVIALLRTHFSGES